MDIDLKGSAPSISNALSTAPFLLVSVGSIRTVTVPDALNVVNDLPAFSSLSIRVGTVIALLFAPFTETVTGLPLGQLSK